jgi:H+-translocating NAD(P) transhydrogenase subunit alpha
MMQEPKNRRTKEPRVPWFWQAVPRTQYLVLSTKYSTRRLTTAILATTLTLLFCPPLWAESPNQAGATTSTSSTIPTMLFVFMLATFIGLGVITRVSRLLHTPLMSLTNAISAIAVVGAIAVAGAEHPFYINLLGAIALFASTTNIVSGFLITDRMLKMFRRH